MLLLEMELSLVLVFGRGLTSDSIFHFGDWFSLQLLTRYWDVSTSAPQQHSMPLLAAQQSASQSLMVSLSSFHSFAAAKQSVTVPSPLENSASSLTAQP